jgi:hypothetical protein
MALLRLAFCGLPNYPLNPRQVLDILARETVRSDCPQTEDIGQAAHWPVPQMWTRQGVGNS